MWCHPGGGPLEYDRDGYRYDGESTAGLNPNRNTDNGVVRIVEPNNNELGTNPGGIRFGDYWVFEPASGLVDKSPDWETGGSAEVDCLWCHYTGYYNYQARNYCISEIGGDKGLEYGPTFGLVGTKFHGEPPLVLMEDDKTGEGGSAEGNPSCVIAGYADLGVFQGFPVFFQLIIL